MYAMEYLSNGKGYAVINCNLDNSGTSKKLWRIPLIDDGINTF